MSPADDLYKQFGPRPGPTGSNGRFKHKYTFYVYVMKLGRKMRAAPRGFSAQMGDSNTNIHFMFMFTSGGDEARA